MQSEMMTYHSKPDIGLAIRRAQKISSKTNIELAKHFDVHPVHFSRWRKQPDQKIGRVFELAQVFGLSFDEFLDLGR